MKHGYGKEEQKIGQEEVVIQMQGEQFERYEDGEEEIAHEIKPDEEPRNHSPPRSLK